MEGRSKIKKGVFLENGWTDFDKQNISCNNQKDYFEEKV